MIMLVNTTPDRIPSDIIAEEQNATAYKADDTWFYQSSIFRANSCAEYVPTIPWKVINHLYL